MARLFLPTIFILLAISIGCKEKSKPVSNNGSSETVNEQAEQSDSKAISESELQIAEITKAEELIGALARKMSQLSHSFQDHSVPLEGVVQSKIDYVGLEGVDLQGLGATGNRGLPVFAKIQIAETETELDVENSRIWSSITNEHPFESCQFGTVGSHFEQDHFITDTVFEGRFRTSEQVLVGVKATQSLKWTSDEEDQWSIAGWKQTSFEMVSIDKPLFVDVTSTAIPDAATLEKVQDCSHCKLIVKNANRDSAEFKPARKKFKYFSDWESAYQFPAVSAVDYDGDGFDDLFVTDRWSPAQLLRNQGDGTFEDVTESSGLIVDELASCALFADFDNDGDPDVFVGGTLNPSQYFRNEGGVFQKDSSLDFALKDVRFVVSGTVADINQDGLLDIYLSTYGIGSGQVDEWVGEALRSQDREGLRQRLFKSHFYIDRAGPPNVVLMNRRGKLIRANKIDDDLKQWRNTYQSIAADFDADGDQDLYVCNDFAPDSFLRNETEPGSFEPKFVEASKEFVPDGEMGFGMGASLGDYNNDGLLDIYVSNMYSKAGKRILKKFPDVDERAKTASRGNFLFENTGGKFKQVAGHAETDKHVSKVGWSFGGQFADFDNDSNLDIYVPSGFYTPPAEVRKEGDW